MGNSSRKIKISADLTSSDIEDILNKIKQGEAKFKVYDPHYPSPSDPGAYISYANFDRDNNQWQMTLGNHGWSGGIYLVKNEVVVQQLKNIAFTQGSTELVVKGAFFFSHYPIESKERILTMNSKLAELHNLTPNITSR